MTNTAQTVAPSPGPHDHVAETNELVLFPLAARITEDMGEMAFALLMATLQDLGQHRANAAARTVEQDARDIALLSAIMAEAGPSDLSAGTVSALKARLDQLAPALRLATSSAKPKSSIILPN